MLLLSAICVAVGPDRAAFLPCSFIKSRPVGKAHMHSLRCTTLPVSPAAATAACVLTICPCLCGVSIGVPCGMHPRSRYYVCVCVWMVLGSGLFACSTPLQLASA